MFINRRNQFGKEDYKVLVGIILFALTMIVVLLIKSKFLLMYTFQFYQLLINRNKPKQQSQVRVKKQKGSNLFGIVSFTNQIFFNFLFFLTIMVSTVIFSDFLSVFISAVGCIIGTIEIIFFPFMIINKINKKVKFFAWYQMWLVNFVGISIVLLNGVCFVSNLVIGGQDGIE